MGHESTGHQLERPDNLGIHYIAVEGVIGVGKTSMVHRLCEKLGARAVLEQVEENPFLASFYKDSERFAFQAQIFFLLSRYKQQKSIGQADMFHELIISDYMFAKDRIFANLNLDDQELILYERLATLLEKTAEQPDMVLYLQARTDVLMQRIKQRGRAFEKRINKDYIEALNEAYNRFFFNYTASPVIIVDTNDVDFRHDDDSLEHLVEFMWKTERGTRVWIPGQSSMEEL